MWKFCQNVSKSGVCFRSLYGDRSLVSERFCTHLTRRLRSNVVGSFDNGGAIDKEVENLEGKFSSRFQFPMPRRSFFSAPGNCPRVHQSIIITFSIKPTRPESTLFQRVSLRKPKHNPSNTGMANNAVWQVLHFLCILAHIGMFAAGLASFLVNGVSDVTGGGDEIPDYANHVAYPWAVGGIVSYSSNVQQSNNLSRSAFMSS